MVLFTKQTANEELQEELPEELQQPQPVQEIKPALEEVRSVLVKFESIELVIVILNNHPSNIIATIKLYNLNNLI